MNNDLNNNGDVNLNCKIDFANQSSGRENDDSVVYGEIDDSILSTSMIVQDQSYVAYDNYKLPIIRRSGFENEGLEKYIDQIRPITEAVSVSLLDDLTALITIGSNSSVLKLDREEYYSRSTGMVGEFSVDKLGPYTVVTVAGSFIERNVAYNQDGKKLTLAFADEVHAYQFKEDLLLALTQGKTPYKVVRKPPLQAPNQEAVEVYHYPKKSRGWFGFSAGIILGLSIFAIFSLINKDRPNSESLAYQDVPKMAITPEVLRELEAIAASRPATQQAATQQAATQDSVEFPVVDVVKYDPLDKPSITVHPLRSQSVVIDPAEPAVETHDSAVNP